MCDFCYVLKKCHQTYIVCRNNTLSQEGIITKEILNLNWGCINTEATQISKTHFDFVLLKSPSFCSFFFISKPTEFG